MARLKIEVKNYDKIKNCNHLCPQECESTQYKISESTFSLADFSYSELYSSKDIPSMEKKLNRPLFFSIFINDLPFALNLHSKLFADDTTLYKTFDLKKKALTRL